MPGESSASGSFSIAKPSIVNKVLAAQFYGGYRGAISALRDAVQFDSNNRSAFSIRRCWTAVLIFLRVPARLSRGSKRTNYEADFQTMSLTGRRSRVQTLYERMCSPVARDDRSAVDPAKALVIAHLEVLVSDGFAEWSPLDNGEVELRFFSGETFLLGASSVTRII